jgi:hypothetical protein
MPTIREMIDDNQHVIMESRKHPREISEIFTEVAKLQAEGNPEKMYDTLDKGGKLVLNGSRTAAGVALSWKTVDGKRVVDKVARLPSPISDALVAQGQRNLGKESAANDAALQKASIPPNPEAKVEEVAPVDDREARWAAYRGETTPEQRTGRGVIGGAAYRAPTKQEQQTRRGVIRYPGDLAAQGLQL